MGGRCTGINRYAQTLVRIKTRELIGKYGFTSSDVQDVEQDLLLDLVRRLPHFDPCKAKLSTFTVRIVENHIATIIMARLATKRDYRSCAFSLDEQVRSDAHELNASRRDSFDNDDYMRRTQGAHRTEEESRDLTLDVAAAVQRLPKQIQDLCARLQASSISEVAAETGIPRGTLYEHLKRVRAAFLEAGLDDYL